MENETEITHVASVNNDTGQNTILETTHDKPVVHTDTPKTTNVINVQKTFERKTYPEGTHKEPYKIGCACEKCVDYKAKQLRYREERKAKKEKAQNKTNDKQTQQPKEKTVETVGQNTNVQGGNENYKQVTTNEQIRPVANVQVLQQQPSNTNSNSIDDDLLRFAPKPQVQPSVAPVAPVPNEVNFSDFVTGHMLLMALDYSFPFVAKHIYGRFVDKRYQYLNKKGVEELKLTPSEKKELEKSADEMVKILFKDIPPQYTFLIMYGMICFGKISMLNDTHFDKPEQKKKDEKNKD